MSVLGQKAKYSERADDFRLTPKNGHQNSVRAYVFRFRIPHYQSVRIGEGFDAAIRVGYLADSNLSLGASARFRARRSRALPIWSPTAFPRLPKSSSIMPA
jgi:hypothetical protein